MCVLVGCDYVDSIKGIGVEGAVSRRQRAGALNDSRIRKIVRLQLSIKSSKYSYRDGTGALGEHEQCKTCRAHILHHIVYDADSKQCVHLNPLDERIINTDGKPCWSD